MEDVAIKVEQLSKTFKLPHEKQSSIKGVLVSKFRGGKRSFEKQAVLKDISFEIKKGEFFGIVGRNGSGKSTLLKLIAGIYSPDKGAIRVNGKLTPFIELGVGFNPELTGRENVFLNGALLGFNRKEMTAMYDEIVAFAEIQKFMDQKLKNYSSGMQVRLAFSIAIRANTDILVLDEVLAVGDAAFQQKCFDYFEKLKTSGKTVVLVTHDMGAVRRFCTSAIYIKSGKLIHEGNVEEVADIYVAENMKEVPRTNDDGLQLSSEHSMSAKITEQTHNKIIYKINYKSKIREQIYIGISVIHNGISIAEITTSQQKPLTGSGAVTYILDTTAFNGGAYRIGAALFRLRNRELIAVNKNRNNFVIKGDDITRGAVLKLADTWEYE